MLSEVTPTSKAVSEIATVTDNDCTVPESTGNFPRCNKPKYQFHGYLRQQDFTMTQRAEKHSFRGLNVE